MLILVGMQKITKTILLIDGENLLHQSFHKFQNLHSSNGEPSGAIFGFFRSLRSLIIRFNANDVYITFDNGHSAIRDKLHPGYKAHRVNLAIDYNSLQKQKRDIIKMLGYLRIKYIYDVDKVTNYEGDDLLAYTLLKYLPTKGLKPSNRRFIIISSDKDFNQLIQKGRIKVYNPRKDSLIYEYNCKALFGYTPQETVDYLIMVGDKSDDIKGFSGIGKVKARSILDKYGTIEKFLEEYPDKEFKRIYKLNRKLIDIKYFLQHNKLPLENFPLVKYPSPEIDSISKVRFYDMCKQYSFRDIQEILDTIIEYKISKYNSI